MTNLLMLIEVFKWSCRIFMMFIRNFLAKDIIDEMTGEKIGGER